MEDLSLVRSLAPPGALWLVGGFLRDALLGRRLSDVDFAVKGDPRALSRAFAGKLKASSFPLDEDRGVYRVVAGERTYDFAALQGATIEKDLAGRDFTVNALAMPLEAFLAEGVAGRPLDLFGGLKDLKARRLRVVREAALKEDPLRLLRAVRLSAELDFQVEPKTAALLKKHARGISRSAPERVREELMKTLSTPRAADAFRLLDKARILSVLFPEAEAMRKSGRGYYGKEGVLGHSLDAMASFERLLLELKVLFPKFHGPLAAHLTAPAGGYPRFALLKLGELFHDAGKPATEGRDEDGKVHFYGHEHAGAGIAAKTAARWRFSNDESRSLTRLVRGHMRPGGLGNAPALSERAIYRFFRDMEEDAVGLLVMALGDHFTYLSEKARRGRKDPVYLAIRRMLEAYYLRPRTVEPPKLLDGHALMRALKMKPGPRVGEFLEALREAQAAGKVKSKAEALTFVKALQP